METRASPISSRGSRFRMARTRFCRVTPRAIEVLPHFGTLCDAFLRMFDGLPCDLFRSFELRNFLNLFGMQCLERGVANLLLNRRIYSRGVSVSLSLVRA